MNIDEYRKGYKDGVYDSNHPGNDIARAVVTMGGMVEHPDYRKGYADGLNGRDFDPYPNTDDAEDSDSDDSEYEDTAEEWRGSSGYSGSVYSSGGSSTYESVKPELTVKQARWESFVFLIFWAIPALFVAWSWQDYGQGQGSGLFFGLIWPLLWVLGGFAWLVRGLFGSHQKFFLIDIFFQATKGMVVALLAWRGLRYFVLDLPSRNLKKTKAEMCAVAVACLSIIILSLAFRWTPERVGPIRVFIVDVGRSNHLTIYATGENVDDGTSLRVVNETPDTVTVRFKSGDTRLSKVELAKFGRFETGYVDDYTHTISGPAIFFWVVCVPVFVWVVASKGIEDA